MATVIGCIGARSRRAAHRGRRPRFGVRSGLVAGSVLVAGITGAIPSVAGAVTVTEGAGSYRGVFTETTGGATAGYDISGKARMSVTATGTSAEIVVAGLDPTKAYGAHLHNGSCADGGGGHYQDVEGGAVTPPNELWLASSGTTLTASAGGVATGSGSATWQARIATPATNARSVVVHEPGGARIACADLIEHPTTLRGVFRTTDGGTTLGYTLDGSAAMVIRSNGTSVTVAIRGLDPTKAYGSHLHNGACSTGGGGHYQDIEGGDTTPPNELWIVTSGTTLTPPPTGVANAAGSATWQPRLTGTSTTARSVVIHEPGGARIACADLRQQELTGPFASATGSNGAVARLYVAVFQRQPDTAGHTYWVAKAGAGVKLIDIAGLFVTSDEFVATYASLDNSAFVNLLYRNVMIRTGDDAGVAYWNGLLTSGTSRAAVTLAFSDSPEFKSLTETS